MLLHVTCVINCYWLFKLMVVYVRISDRSLKKNCGQHVVKNHPSTVVFLNDDNSVNKVFVVGDTRQICHASNMSDGLLQLFSVYYLLNLNYPSHWAQMLGLLQHMCLNMELPQQMHSATFDRFRESLI